MQKIAFFRFANVCRNAFGSGSRLGLSLALNSDRGLESQQCGRRSGGAQWVWAHRKSNQPNLRLLYRCHRWQAGCNGIRTPCKSWVHTGTFAVYTLAFWTTEDRRLLDLLFVKCLHSKPPKLGELSLCYTNDLWQKTIDGSLACSKYSRIRPYS